MHFSVPPPPPQYLHNDKKLLHGDIKSSNVVVKGDFEAVKICDVGVSLPLDENMTGRGAFWGHPNARGLPDPWRRGCGSSPGGPDLSPLGFGSRSLWVSGAVPFCKERI